MRPMLDRLTMRSNPLTSLCLILSLSKDEAGFPMRLLSPVNGLFLRSFQERFPHIAREGNRLRRSSLFVGETETGCAWDNGFAQARNEAASGLLDHLASSAP